jgi:hypothetical protein
MCKHEEKYCGHCNALFECKPGAISQCQCYGIKLSEAERNYIATKYPDCLCASCIVLLKKEFNIAQREIQLKVFFNGR